MEQQTAHSSMIIAEITKIWLGIPQVCMHACTDEFLVASVRVTLERGVLCFLSWTVSTSRWMFGTAQYQLFWQWWGVHWCPM